MHTKADALKVLNDPFPKTTMKAKKSRKDVGNGTLDVKSGRLLPHDPTHMISMVAPVTYDPSAKCPRWQSFLEEIFEAHPELIPFACQLCGYCLTGDTSGQFFLLLYGTSANGKTTLLSSST